MLCVLPQQQCPTDFNSCLGSLMGSGQLLGSEKRNHTASLPSPTAESTELNWLCRVTQLNLVPLLPETTRARIRATCGSDSRLPVSCSCGRLGYKPQSCTPSFYIIQGFPFSFLEAAPAATHKKYGPNLRKFSLYILAYGVRSPRHKSKQHPCMPCENWGQFYLCLVELGLLMLML